MQRLFKLYDEFAWWADWVTKYFCVFLSAVMFIVVMAQVFFNYVLRSGAGRKSSRDFSWHGSLLQEPLL